MLPDLPLASPYLMVSACYIAYMHSLSQNDFVAHFLSALCTQDQARIRYINLVLADYAGFSGLIRSVARFQAHRPVIFKEICRGLSYSFLLYNIYHILLFCIIQFSSLQCGQVCLKLLNMLIPRPLSQPFSGQRMGARLVKVKF